MILVGYYIAFLLVCIASYTDVKKLQIPNKISALPYILGITLYIIQQDYKGLVGATIIATLIFVILLLLYITKGLGAGDVKFISGLSFLIESKPMWNLLFFSFCIAGIIAISIFCFRCMLKLSKLIKQLLDKRANIFNSFTVRLNPKVNFIIHKLTIIKQIPFMIAVFPAYTIVFYFEVIL